MKLKHYNLRKYWKKLRRQRKRREKAQLRDFVEESSEEMENNISEINIEEVKWLEREREAQELWKLKQQNHDISIIERNVKVVIAAPYKNNVIKSLSSQSASLNERSNLVSTLNDIPYRNPDLPSELVTREICQFYRKTGSCRFEFRCSRLHESPVVSDTILFFNMFNTFSSDAMMVPGDSDGCLEYDEEEFLSEYTNFYDDVKLELSTYGRIITIRTCRNAMKHLRGNVYVQYYNINDAVYALSELNGRYFAGKPLSGRFVTIESWRESICGLYHRGRCSKGTICNFLHVFLNPCESVQSLFRFLNRPTRQLLRVSTRRYDSSTCSSTDGVKTPEPKERKRSRGKHRNEKKKHKRDHSSRSHSRRSDRHKISTKRYKKSSRSRESKRKHSSSTDEKYSEIRKLSKDRSSDK